MSTINNNLYYTMKKAIRHNNYLTIYYTLFLSIEDQSLGEGMSSLIPLSNNFLQLWEKGSQHPQ